MQSLMPCIVRCAYAPIDAPARPYFGTSSSIPYLLIYLLTRTSGTSSSSRYLLTYLLTCTYFRYVELNAGVFAHEDVAYVLAFSIIMLNTDAHSTQARHAHIDAVGALSAWRCVDGLPYSAVSLCG